MPRTAATLWSASTARWLVIGVIVCGVVCRGSNSAEGLAPSSIGQVTSFQLAQRWYEESKSHGREARFDQAVHALHETLRLWPLHSQANRDLGTLLSSVTLTPRGSAAGRYATRSVAGVNAHVGAHRDWAESQFRQLLDAVVLSDLSLWNREQRLVWQTPAEDLTAGQALTRAQHVALLTVTPPLQGAPCDVMQPITDWISGPDVHSVTPMPAEASTSTHHSPPEHDIATGQHAFLVRLHNVTVSGWEPVVWGPCHVYLPVHGPFISLILGEHGFQNTSSLDGRPMRHVHLDEAVSFLQMRYLSYYHWMLECLPRLLYLIPILQQHRSAVLLVPESKEAFVAESLSMLHLTPVPASAAASLRAMPPAVQRRWKPGHAAPMRVAVQWVSPAVAVHARTLHTADWTPAWRHSRGATTHGLRRLRDAISRYDRVPPAQRQAVVLVSRPVDGPRGASNEAVLLSTLTQAVVSLGFELVVFQAERSGSLHDVRALFAKARVVVGVHGGGLANIVFLAPGATLIEVAMAEPLYNMYEHAANALGVQYHPLRCIPPNSFHTPVEVCVEETVDAVVGALRASLTMRDGVEPKW